MSTFTLSLLGNFSPKSWLCGLGFHKWITYSTVEVSTSKENVTVYQHWQERAIKYGKVVGEICKVAMVDLVGIEYPAFFNSAGGTMVAKKGDLLKLTFLVGIIYTYVRRHQGIKVLLVPVNEWKGQLPKEIVMMSVS